MFLLRRREFEVRSAQRVDPMAMSRVALVAQVFGRQILGGRERAATIDRVIGEPFHERQRPLSFFVTLCASMSFCVRSARQIINDTREFSPVQKDALPNRFDPPAPALPAPLNDSPCEDWRHRLCPTNNLISTSQATLDVKDSHDRYGSESLEVPSARKTCTCGACCCRASYFALTRSPLCSGRGPSSSGNSTSTKRAGIAAAVITSGPFAT